MIDGETAFLTTVVTIAAATSTAIPSKSNDGKILADRAIITPKDNTIIFRYDGLAADLTAPYVLGIGEFAIIEGYSNINNFRAVTQGGAVATQVIVTLEAK